jgi:glutathione S-transferase
LFVVQFNPQHCIPTLNDNGFVMWESRAIQLYLVEQYAKTDSLYPKDFEKRAVVNQLLNFDMGTLYQCFADYYYSQLLDKLPADPEKFKKMTEAVELFDKFISGRVYAAMDTLTLADFTLLSTISTYDIAGFNLSKYENVTKWYELCKRTVPGYEANRAGAESFKRVFVNLEIKN